MMNLWETDYCGCEQSAFTALPENVDCLPLPRHSQIAGLIMLPLGAALPTDWTNAESFLERLDNTDTIGTKGKYLLGIGSIEPATDVLVSLGRNHEHIATRKWTLNFAPQIGYAAQYAFLQSLQKSRRNFRFWFATMGGRLIGGANGIRPEFITAKVFYPGAAEDIEAASISIRWAACAEPPRSNAASEIFNLDLPGYYSVETGGTMGSLKVITQAFYNQISDTFVFTENGGAIPPDSLVGIYQNGQKMRPNQYVKIGSAFTIDPNSHLSGDNYEVAIIILE